MNRYVAIIGFLAVLGLLMACGRGTPVTGFDLESAFPNAGAVMGWEPEAEISTYSAETLYDLVDGQAEAFFAYNFRAVAVREYQHSSGVPARVEIWELATAEDAYGVFTRGLAGGAVAVGNAGDLDPGRRVAFWQDRYRVQIRAREPVPDAELLRLCYAIAAALPKGGAIPEVVTRLPDEGLVPRSPVYFRLEISIQDEVWLGGENALGLSLETEGVMARYELGNSSAYLMLVRYPTEEASRAGLAGLRALDVVDLVASESEGPMLSAVFGAVDIEAAQQLAREAVQPAAVD